MFGDMDRVVLVLVAALVLAVLATPPPPARACAGIGRRGPVFVRGEEALLVWDEARHVEHFVRRAFLQGVS